MESSDERSGFIYYRLIDIRVVTADSLQQVRGNNDPVCYKCSLKFDPDKDAVTIGVSYTHGDEVLICCVCGQHITEDHIINEIHTPKDRDKPHDPSTNGTKVYEEPHKTIIIEGFKVKRPKQ
jgi:hypothetical protein